jgi:N-acetylglutamate synthase-like GNAT family acetyltransferase
MDSNSILFRSGKIDFCTDWPSADEYYNLFLTTRWNDEYCLSKEEIEKSIRNRWFSISAYSGEELIGTGSILSDGIQHALIVNMIVHPDFRNQGIGTAILRLLVNKCKECNIRDIQLFAAQDKHNFYRKFGFVARADNAPGMQYRYR